MMNRSTQKHVSTGILLGILLCLAIVPAVSAFTATQTSSGTTLYSGDPISIQIAGLADGDQFTYKLTSSNLQTPSNTVTLSGVTMPFALQTGTAQTSLTTTGTTSGSTSLTVTAGDGSSITLPSSGNTISTTKNIAKDTYTVTMSGTKASTDATIGIDYSVSGKASAPTNPSTLSFNVKNVNTGDLTVQILQGSTVVFQQTYTIIVRDGGSSTSGGSSSPSGGSAGPAVAPAVAPAAQLAPAGVTATTATLQHNEQGQVLANYAIETDPAAGFASTLDVPAGIAVLTPAGQPVSQISVEPVASSSVPSNPGSTFSGLAVEYGPSGTTFSQPVTGSFTLTDAQWSSALEQTGGNTHGFTVETFTFETTQISPGQILRDANGYWTPTPTTVNTVTRTISFHVPHFSTYALFYNTSTAVTANPKTIGELANLPASTPAPVAPVSTSAAVPVNTQLAPITTPVQNAGIFDGVFVWFGQLFGIK